MKTRIHVVQKIDSRIAGAAKYSGDVSDFANGRNGLAAAIRCVDETHASNIRSFGNIGCGRTFLEYRTGDVIARPCGLLELIPGMTAQDVQAGNSRIAAEIAQEQADEKAGEAAGYAGLPRQPGASYEWERGYELGASYRRDEREAGE
jgi:hypothetical protein